MTMISQKDLEVSIAETKELQKTMIQKKYTEGDEKTYEDIIERIIDRLETKRGHPESHPYAQDDSGMRRYMYSSEEFEDMKALLREGYFIPAGSILSGVTNTDKKSSLSNCYVSSFKDDSIESIFNYMRDAARTYSYRGGVGVDISTLRPADTKVNNSAKTSTGAVSFMPLLSMVNSTIGQLHRRGASLDSIWCWHPDYFRFVWCKAMPEAVFPMDNMSYDRTAKDLQRLDTSSIDPKVASILSTLAWSGKTPDVDAANISVKFTEEFMCAVKARSTDPVVFKYPNIEANKAFYNEHWKGDLQDWIKIGGEIKNYTTSTLICTRKTLPIFENKTIDHVTINGKILTKDDEKLSTVDWLSGLLDQYQSAIRVTFKNPSAYECFRDLAKAAWIRADPGVLFWDRVCDWTTFAHIDPKTLTPVSTNPCFTLDTKVAVADGRGEVDFATLIQEGKDVPLYTRDPETGKLIIKMGRNPRLTRVDAKIIRVTLDDGSYIDTTEDHKYILQDGRVVEARDVKPGDALYPLTRKAMSFDRAILHTEEEPDSKKDHLYWWLKTDTNVDWISEHTLLYYHANPTSYKERQGWHIHHKDHNGLNNSLDNLERLSAEVHTRMHVEAHMLGDANPMRQHPEKSLFNDPDWQQEIREKYHIGAKRSETTCTKISQKAKERFADPEWKEWFKTRISNYFTSDPEAREKLRETQLTHTLDYMKTMTDLPLTVVEHNGHKTVSVIKHCEVCGQEFIVPFCKRERAYCSQTCMHQSPEWIHKQKSAREIASQQKASEYELVKCDQIKTYNDLKERLGRTPQYKEFKEFADQQGVPSRICGLHYGFGNYQNLVQAAATANHRVVSVERIGTGATATITVDDVHALYVRTNPGDAALRDYNYVLLPQCSEIPGWSGSSCLLGAHVLSKYVIDAWTPNAHFDYPKFAENCITATLLMNFFTDYNEPLHPLKEQRDADTYAKRIGIEFTGLADMLSMLNIVYDSHEALQVVHDIMHLKGILEIATSAHLAMTNGPCPACDPLKNPQGLQRLIASDYFTNLLDTYTLSQTALDMLDCPKAKAIGISKKHTREVLESSIESYGLRNVAFNTVGPTGTISILANNCSSGIEPVFALFMKRNTRVGDKGSYNICHTPVAEHLLTYMKEHDLKEIDSSEVKKMYSVKEAYEINYHSRIAMQETVQDYCDSSISSTVNLPNSATPEEILEIYLEAWQQGLKGITIFRDGSLNAVLEVMKSDAPKKEEKQIEVQATPSKTLTRGDIIEMPTVAYSHRHEVHWEGHKFYIVITVDETGAPMEVFTSNLPSDISVKDGSFNESDYQFKQSLWIGICRLISISLRGGVPVSAIIKQLDKAKNNVTDIMAVIARVLGKYTTSAQSPALTSSHLTMSSSSGYNFQVCPECGKKTLKVEAGCKTCLNCTYSKCE